MYEYWTSTLERGGEEECAMKDVLASTLDGGVPGNLQTHLVNVHTAS